MKFSFKASKSAESSKNALISFDELKLSQSLQKDIKRPKPLWEVIEDIHIVLKENSILFDQEEIFVEKATSIHSIQNKNNVEMKFNHKDPGSFANWMFGNLYTKIVIKDDLNEFEGAIAISFNPYGMQLAFGLTYEERSKFAHFGEEETIMSTTACGEIKVIPYFVMMHKVRQWCPFDNNNTIAQLKKTRSLMNKTLSYEYILQFIEQFYQNSMKYNDCLEDNMLVEQLEFDLFVERLRIEAKETFASIEKISAWDLFTLGNAILKPDADFNLKSLIPIGFIWGGYVFSRLT